MGKLTKIKKLLLEMLLQFSQISTDKGVMQYDGDDIVEGIQVWLVSEDGERVNAGDGIYRDSNDTEYTVEGGRITAIKVTEKMESQVEPEPQPAAEPETTEQTEPQEETVVETVEQQEPEKQEPEEPQPDQKDKVIADLQATISELSGKLNDLRTQFEQFQAKPQAEPITETYKTVNGFKTTGNEGLDRLARIVQAK